MIDPFKIQMPGSSEKRTAKLKTLKQRTMETKQCKSCKQEKTSENFYKKGKYLYRKCKQCVSDDNFIKNATY